jgi:hypothetical protein
MPDRPALTRNAYSGAVLPLQKPSIHGPCSPVPPALAICNSNGLSRAGLTSHTVRKRRAGARIQGETQP